MKSEVYKEKVNIREEFVARIMNSAVLLKQEHQDDKRATCTVVKWVEKCIVVDGGIFEELLELLQFIEIIYITSKWNQ
jgi:hypothetical protein